MACVCVCVCVCVLHAMASTSRPLVEGPLSKWTNVVSGWQYRWFVLDQSSGMLSYYTVRSRDLMLLTLSLHSPPSVQGEDDQRESSGLHRAEEGYSRH